MREELSSDPGKQGPTKRVTGERRDVIESALSGLPKALDSDLEQGYHGIIQIRATFRDGNLSGIVRVHRERTFDTGR